MRRALGTILIAGLLLGAAACGSSGGSDSSSAKSDTTEATSGSGGSTSSGNADVKAYCKAVDEYVKKVKAAQNDPAKAAALSTESQDLSKKAAALATANLSSDDAKAVGDCTKKSTDALMPS